MTTTAAAPTDAPPRAVDLAGRAPADAAEEPSVA